MPGVVVIVSVIAKWVLVRQQAGQGGVVLGGVLIVQEVELLLGKCIFFIKKKTLEKDKTFETNKQSRQIYFIKTTHLAKH